MSATPRFCAHCGSALTPGKRFCEACGAPVVESPVQTALPPPPPPPPTGAGLRPVPPPPAGVPAARPAPSTARPAKRSGCGGIGLWLGMALIAGTLFCLTAGIVGALWYANRSDSRQSAVGQVEAPPSASAREQAAPVPESAEPALPSQEPAAAVQPAAEATAPPPPTLAPPPPSPTSEVVLQSPGQELKDYLFRDDFETTFMGWSTGSDEEADWDYQEGQYLMRVKVSNQPLSFDPPIANFKATTFEFDAAASGKTGDGGTGEFGVLCDYESDNDTSYVVVAVEPYTQIFSITQYKDNAAGASTGRMDVSGIRSGPGESNHYLIECQWDRVAVFINNEYVTELQVSGEMQGFMSLFIANWGPTDPDYFQVKIDNFSAWVPVQ